jgi:5-oxopent-3-ene-1,2,5-tricarboxylate decarboxylase/2-hydroxyhepta-2,4-diene-1,7-dioate isomerase
LPNRRHSVIGVALNFRETLNRLAPSFSAPPYQKQPQWPVLYLKTPNTWIASGQPIHCPPGVSQLRMGGTLALVIARTARAVKADGAHHYVGALAVVNDVSIPHDSYYRPALRERCSDSFCSIGTAMPISPTGLSADFEIDVLVNNILRSSVRTSSLVRAIPQLIQDISEFMTLQAGDLVLIGEPESSPIVGPGSKVRVEIPTVGSIENTVVGS